MPHVHALLAAAALLFGHSAEHRPLTRDPRRRGPRQGARRRLDPRQRDRPGTRSSRACGGCAPPAGVELWLVRLGQPGRRAATHAPERTRGRPQSQLRAPLARRRAPLRHLLPGPRARSPSPSRGRCGGWSGRSAPTSPCGTTSTCAWSTSPAAPTRRSCAPTPAASGCPARTLPVLPRHRDELAERRVRRHELVRRRAARRPRCPRVRSGATPRPPGGARRASAAARRRGAPRPRIVGRRIPFGATRRAQMRAYARRHYGIATAALRAPKVIVEHFTASGDVRARPSTRSPPTRPTSSCTSGRACARTSSSTATGRSTSSCRCGGCAATRSGSTTWRSGSSTSATPTPRSSAGRRRSAPRCASRAGCRARYGIRRRDVIGHAESLSSPYHHERVARLRRQTHGDFARTAMRRYRARL